MRNISFKKFGKEWVQVDKRVAKRLFDIEKKPIVFLPRNANPNYDIFLGAMVDPKTEGVPWFEQYLSEFLYYNCNTSELGRTAIFFAEKAEKEGDDYAC